MHKGNLGAEEYFRKILDDIFTESNVRYGDKLPDKIIYIHDPVNKRNYYLKIVSGNSLEDDTNITFYRYEKRCIEKSYINNSKNAA